MPKECRRQSAKDLRLSVASPAEGPRPERRAARSPSPVCDDPARNALGPPLVMDARAVPQVTITPEVGGSSREMQQEDWDDVVDGPLRRHLSNSSISSAGSSAVESEDDLLSDSESKSKGIVTLEHLVDAGEVSRGCCAESIFILFFRFPGLSAVEGGDFYFTTHFMTKCD